MEPRPNAKLQKKAGYTPLPEGHNSVRDFPETRVENWFSLLRRKSARFDSTCPRQRSSSRSYEIFRRPKLLLTPFLKIWTVFSFLFENFQVPWCVNWVFFCLRESYFRRRFQKVFSLFINVILFLNIQKIMNGSFKLSNRLYNQYVYIYNVCIMSLIWVMTFII